MKAVRVIDQVPQLVDLPVVDDIASDHVRVTVASSSICGSDHHMIEMGIVEGLVIGHEFAGTTPDGTAVAVEPIRHCGHCPSCGGGFRNTCTTDMALIGVTIDGGMATEVVVPINTLVKLPSGVDISTASLVEPLAVSTHAINYAELTADDRVLVIGAGPIGLAAAAVLADRGLRCDIAARHPHQQEAAAMLGANLDVGDGYDVVVDAVGTTDSMSDAVQALRPRGRLVVVGTFWDNPSLDVGLQMKEVQIIPAMAYAGLAPNRDFDMAARALANNPRIADALITHRFPLDGVTEAFDVSRNRSAGAIKVVFEP